MYKSPERHSNKIDNMITLKLNNNEKFPNSMLPSTHYSIQKEMFHSDS